MSRRLRHATRSARGPAVALAAVALLAGCTAGGDGPSPTSSLASDQGGPVPGGSATPGGATGAPSSSPEATPTPSVTVTGSSGQDGAASEVLPESSAAPSPSLGVELPHLTQAPSSADAHGSLVQGFPSDLVPVPEDATIVASSITSQGDHVQVGLTATEEGGPDQVGADYTARMAGLGYLTTHADAAPGSTATQYVRGRDVVVLTLRPRTGGGSELVLTGVLVVSG